MTAPTPHSRAPSSLRDYAAPASAPIGRGGHKTAQALGVHRVVNPAAGLDRAKGSNPPCCAISSGWEPTEPERSGAACATPAVFPRAAGAFLQPLSGGMTGGVNTVAAPSMAKSHVSCHPSAATKDQPHVPHCPSAVVAHAAAHLSPRALASMPGARDAGSAWMDQRPCGDATAGYRDRYGAAYARIVAKCRGTASPRLVTASTLAGSQPVAVDAAPQWCSDGRSADCHGYDRRPSHAGRVRFVRHGAGSAAPRGRSIAGGNYGRTQARPELAACSTVQARLAGAARPGPFPREGRMRLTVQRARIIDTIRAYGPLAEEVISPWLGVSKRNTSRQIAGMVGEGAIDLRGGVIHLKPAGYAAVGSFPPKREPEQ